MTPETIRAKIDSKTKDIYAGGPPQFDDPQLQQYRTRYLADKEVLVSNPGQLIPPIDGPNACPDLAVGDIERMFLGTTRDELAARGAAVSDIRFRVVEGTCVEGKLEGPARIVWNDRLTVDNEHVEIALHRATAQTATYRSGKLLGESATFLSYRNQTRYKDRKTAAMLASTIEEQANRVDLSVSYSNMRGERFEGPSATFTFQNPGLVESTAVTWELEPGLLFTQTYNGPNLATTAYSQDGKLHGEFVMHAGSYGQGTPEVRQCWANGVQVKESACAGGYDVSSKIAARASTASKPSSTSIAGVPMAPAAQAPPPVVGAPGPRPVAETPWPDLAAVMNKVGGGENDAAVVVGVEDYAFVVDVPGASKNAKDWYRYFTRVRGTSPGNVKLLLDVDATDVGILDAVEQTAKLVKPGGTFWFVFIGHGSPSEDQKDGLLVGVDAQQSARGLFGRSVAQRKVLAAADAGAQARNVFLVDACFSGRSSDGAALAKGLQPLLPVQQEKPAPNGKQTLVFTAGRSDQFAGPLPKLERPAFSYLMLGAMLGWADLNNDSWLSSDELLNFSNETLRAVLNGRNQTPEVSGGTNPQLARSAGVQAPNVTEIVLGD